MLRKIRVSLAVIFWLALTLLFLDFSGAVHGWIGWLAKIQFLPAVLALNVGVIVFLAALTFVFGRVYCSIICPLGVMQDIFAWFGKKAKKNRYTYSPEKKVLRYSILVVFIAAILAGFTAIASIIAPYSMYGRIAQNIFAPVWQWGNNLLALWAERLNSYAFYETDVWLKSLPVFLIAVLSLIVIAVLAWRGGRTYCNTVCPVGSVLGVLAKYSLLRPVIDTSKCVNCKQCSRNCKASCIDLSSHKIDYSRCVSCMDCIDSCHKKAISYTMRNRQLNALTKQSGEDKNAINRRSFLSLATLFVTGSLISAKEKTVDGGLAVIADKKIPKRKTPIVPPGALSLNNLRQHCTGCQLCVSVCSNQVLRPSSDMSAIMQPESSYERGYCRPECTKCSNVCPAGAIRPIDVAEKSSIQIGYAVWVKENCIPMTSGDSCGLCARRCPTGAITMANYDANDPDSPKVPFVNVEKCIGCGACENLCPARPFSAIYVEGIEHHKYI